MSLVGKWMRIAPCTEWEPGTPMCWVRVTGETPTHLLSALANGFATVTIRVDKILLDAPGKPLEVADAPR